MKKLVLFAGSVLISCSILATNFIGSETWGEFEDIDNKTDIEQIEILNKINRRTQEAADEVIDRVIEDLEEENISKLSTENVDEYFEHLDEKRHLSKHEKRIYICLKEEQKLLTFYEHLFSGKIGYKNEKLISFMNSYDGDGKRYKRLNELMDKTEKASKFINIIHDIRITNKVDEFRKLEEVILYVNELEIKNENHSISFDEEELIKKYKSFSKKRRKYEVTLVNKEEPRDTINPSGHQHPFYPPSLANPYPFQPPHAHASYPRSNNPFQQNAQPYSHAHPLPGNGQNPFYPHH